MLSGEPAAFYAAGERYRAGMGSPVKEVGPRGEEWPRGRGIRG